MKEKSQRSRYFHLMFYGDKYEDLWYCVYDNSYEIGIDDYFVLLHNHTELHTHLLIRLQYPIKIDVIKKFFDDCFISIAFVEPINDFDRYKDYLISTWVDLEVGD